MSSKFENLIENDDWVGLRSAILAKHINDRTSVGLTMDSTFSVLQTAALYEPQLVARLREKRLELDLHSACMAGLTDEIDKFATQEALAEEVEYMTPLGYALLKGHVNVVRRLLTIDDPNRSQSRIGFFVWEMEICGKVSCNWSPLHVTSTHGYLENGPTITKLLLDGGAQIDAICPLGCQPIHLAAIYGWLSIAEVLIDHGADVDAHTESTPELVTRVSAPACAIDASELTPLMIAAQEGGGATIEFLLQHGADVAAADSMGNTALHHACNGWWSESIGSVEALVKGGASPDARNKNGKLPVDYAISRQFDQIAKLLS